MQGQSRLGCHVSSLWIWSTCDPAKLSCRCHRWVLDLLMKTETEIIPSFVGMLWTISYSVAGVITRAFGISVSLKLELKWGSHVSGGSGQDPLLGPDLCSNPSPTQQPSRLHCSAQFLGCVILDLHWELWCKALRKRLMCVFYQLNQRLQAAEP